MMKSSTLFPNGIFVRQRIGLLCLFLLAHISLFAVPQNYNQVPLTWGSWFLANESVVPEQAAYLEFNYTGATAEFGFWNPNVPPLSIGLVFSIKLLNNGDAYLFKDGIYLAYFPSLVNTGDVVVLERTPDGLLYIYVNGALITQQANFFTGLTLLPYLDDSNGSQQGNLALFVQDLDQYDPTWVQVINGYQLSAEFLGRGQDGYIEYEYGGENNFKFGFAKGKNPANSRAWARLSYTKSSQQFYFYLNGTLYATYTLANALQVGDLIRIARKGSSAILSAPNFEATYFLDGNIALHPLTYEYNTSQKNRIKLSFNTKGGGSQDYFLNSSPSFNDDQNAYYPPAITEARNYVHTKVYDGSGEGVSQILSESRSYVDDMGRSTQSQSKDYLTGKVWITETLYDQQGRAAISTLSAPTGHNYIQYKNNFVLDANGNPYGHNHFDVDIDNPDPVGAQVNSLGWWYSSHNTEEPWQAITQYPYARTEFSTLTGGARRSAGAGDAYRMGAGHEVVSYSMQALEEVDYLFRGRHPMCLLAGTSYDVGGNLAGQCTTASNSHYVKQISVDPDGKQAVVFVDGDGKEVARALSGKINGFNQAVQSVSVTIPAQSFRDIHVTDEGSSLSLPFENMIYQIFDLSTDQRIYPAPGSPFENGGASVQNLAPGFYRIVNNAQTGFITASYHLNYYNFSLNVYNTAGQMIATVAPNDVVLSTSPSTAHGAYSLYNYNLLGQLIWEQTPDAGRTEYHYRKDGSLRFSQNAQQLIEGKFSYSKYDEAMRVVEVGVCNSLPNNLGDPGLLEDPVYPVAATSERTHNVYDVPVALTGQSQKFVRGRLSHTYNDESKIWYSYDEQGRLTWIAHDIIDHATKITHYRYDLLGNVVETAYEEGGGEDEFHHHYTYDQNGQLKSVSTKHNTQNSIAPDLQAQYTYTPSGALDQKNIADGLESQYFAYTLQGQLKAINPADMAEVSTSLGGNHTFSLALDYYLDDYQAANGGQAGRVHSLFASTKANANYSGNIAAQRWKARADVGSADYSGHFAYAYSFNHRNELIRGRFGSLLAASQSGYTAGFNVTVAYRELVDGYDLNGNVKTYMSRYGPNGENMDNLRFKYDKTNGKNRLRYLDDLWGDMAGVEDLVDQAPNNYEYNAMGQLTEDVIEDFRIEYDVYGHVKKVYERLSNTLKVTYLYDATGQRIGKRLPTANPNETITTYYARGAGGQLQGIYQSTVSVGSEGSNNPTDGLQELPIYGAGRIGVAYYQSNAFVFHYELADHLGNVRAVIYRNIRQEKQVVKYADYYPYGWELPGRTYSSSENYRYGFQGQYAEKDEETGWSSFELRSYDGRVGRWMSPDPYEQYWNPYLAFGNAPHQTVDPDGGFDRWIGAAWYALWNGGNIVKHDGIWAVTQYKQYDLLNGEVFTDYNLVTQNAAANGIADAISYFPQGIDYALGELGQVMSDHGDLYFSIELQKVEGIGTASLFSYTKSTYKSGFNSFNKSYISVKDATGMFDFREYLPSADGSRNGRAIANLTNLHPGIALINSRKGTSLGFGVDIGGKISSNTTLFGYAVPFPEISKLNHIGYRAAFSKDFSFKGHGYKLSISAGARLNGLTK